MSKVSNTRPSTNNEQSSQYEAFYLQWAKYSIWGLLLTMGKVFNMRPSTNNDYKHHDSYTNNET